MVVSGWAHREAEVEAGGHDGAAAGHPAHPGRRAHRRAGPVPGRHRGAPARARAGRQGRHHPRDPPPGEEQPADRGGPAAAAGPPAAGGRDRRARGAARRRSGGSARSPSCTRRCPSTGPTSRRLRRGRRPGRRAHRRGLGAPGTGPRSGATGPSACSPPEVATPLALVLVELVQNAVEHGLRDRGGTVLGRRTPAGGAHAVAGRCWPSTSPTTAPGCRPASTRPATAASGLQIVRTLVEGELGGDAPPRRRRPRHPRHARAPLPGVEVDRGPGLPGRRPPVTR